MRMHLLRESNLTPAFLGWVALLSSSPIASAQQATPMAHPSYSRRPVYSAQVQAQPTPDSEGGIPALVPPRVPGPATAPPSSTPPSSTPPSSGENRLPAEPGRVAGPTIVRGSASDKIQVLNIRDMKMRQVARMLSQGTGRKVVVSQGAADTVINTYLEDVAVEESLKAICLAHNLWFRQDEASKIVTIVTIEEYQKGLQAYPQEKVEVVTVLYPDVRAVGDALQRLFSNRVIWNPPDEFLHDPIIDIERALERMDALADRAQFSLEGSLGSGTGSQRSSFRSGRFSGGGRFGNSRFGNSRFGNSRFGSGRFGSQNGDPSGMLVEDVQREIATDELLARLVEAVPAAQWNNSDPEQPGQNLQSLRPGVVYVSAFKGTNDLMLRSTDPNSIKDVVDVIKQLDKPQPQVLLEVKVLDILLDDEEAYGIDWLFDGGKVSGARSTGINRTGFGAQFASIVKPNPATLVPRGTGMDPRTAVLNVVTEDVRARIQFLKDRGRLVSLATPNLCVADGEASRVFVGTETTILKSIEVETNTTSGNNPVTTRSINPETDRENLGTTLLITPRIHADRTTTIRLIQEESRLGETQTIVYGQDDQGQNQSFQSQDVDTRSVTTTVVAADGNICAIGGLIRESTKQRDVGVPGLMDVPVAGSVFKTTFKDRDRSELLVLIRPFVLLAPGEGEPVSQDFMHRLSEHPSATGDIPPLRIGEASFMVVNENMYHIPKRAFHAIQCETPVWTTEEDECND